MSKERHKIFLAALLHDIGKFYQRADQPYWKSEKLSTTSKNLADVICPQKDTGGVTFPTHQHVIWTNDFLETTLSNQLKDLGFAVNPFDQRDKNENNLINLSVYHHRPSTKIQGLIQMADHWASGIDRTKKDKKSAEEPGKFFKKIPLLSVFSQIYKREKDTSSFYTKASAQNLDESIFPNLEDYEPEYSKLWKEFKAEVATIPTTQKEEKGYSAYIHSLLVVLKKYTSAIPSSTFKADLPSVSLYDHLRITGAIADCLFAYAQENGFDGTFDVLNGNKLRLQDNQLPLVMGCVDLSGIQSFIYNISGSRAAKSLKGRSFYLQLVIDSILDKIILDNDITPAHIIYSSGGKAYFILPNTKKVQQNMKQLHEHILNEIIQQDEKSLYVCMDYIPFKFETHQENNVQLGVHFKKNGEVIHAKNGLAELWRELGEKTGQQKQRKFSQLLVAQFDTFFEPQPLDSQEKVCAVTGKSINKGKNIGHSDNPVFVTEEVFQQIELGKALKDADYIITFSGDKEMPQFEKSGKHRHFNVFNLGVHKYLFDEAELVEDDADFRKITSFDFCRVQRINNTDFDKVNNLKGKGASYGYTFYGGNKQAENSGNVKTHDELADSEGNFTRLGILRMDIDDLGKIFIQGLPEDQRNFATYATLSSQLDLFFSGYLNTIRNKDVYKDRLNILYSGGDDIFAIGRWDKIIDFSVAVKDAFKQFVGGRDDITLSAGIAIVGGKFPIAKAAELAGEAESAAKNYPDHENPEKNAINVFDISLSWDEFAKAKSLKDDFTELIQVADLPRSILQKIQTFYELSREEKDLSWVWNAAYFLKRFQERNKKQMSKNHKYELTMNELKEKMITQTGNDTYWKQLVVAARWAELECRTLKIMKDEG